MEHNQNDIDIGGKTIWGEARGEGQEGRLAVAHVLRNRAERARFAGDLVGKKGAVAHVCQAPYQFSCWNENDPNRVKMLELASGDYADDADLMEDVLDGVTTDPTGGADHYFANTIDPPDWASTFRLTARIGHHIFYDSRPAVVASSPAQLSENFTLPELIFSQEAKDRGIDNIPGVAETANLRSLASRVLQPARNLLSHPMIITSGYRSLALNRAVKGVTNSQHMQGQAADFVCPGFGDPHAVALFLAESDLQFDQLIDESNSSGGHWVHISWSPTPRRETWTISPAGTTKGLVK